MGKSIRIVYFLPNVFTGLNLACGFVSIIFAWKGSFYPASMLLLLGAIFDSVDGRIARLTGTESGFGEQFDSMSDVISFGIAPALLVYNRFFVDLGRIGIVVTFLFLLCGTLRLARFNVNVDKVRADYFQGLPIPGAAIALVSYVLLSLEIKQLNTLPIISIVYTIFYSLLMISNIPFFSFKKTKWVKEHKRLILALIFFLLGLIFIYEEFVIGILITTYVVGSLIYFFLHRGELKDMFLWKDKERNENSKEGKGQ